MSVTDHPVRFVTATSLFDGHDAAINIMRRILQARGVEVIHLGHNRSVDEVVSAVIDEDVQGVAVSSYQGGHVEYFKYLVDRLRLEGYGHVKVFGGGGGVIVADEIEELEDLRGRPHLFSGGRAATRARRDDRLHGCRLRLRPTPPRGCRRVAGRGPSLTGAGDHTRRGRPARRPPVHRGGQGGRAAWPGAGVGHHGHWRLGQVLSHRRAHPASAPRPRGQAEGRRHRRRSHPTARRRRPSR